VCLPYARGKAVALAVVRIRRSTEKVHFIIALEVLVWIDVAVHFQGDPALLRAHPKLPLIPESRIMQRNAQICERRIARAVRHFVMFAPRSFECDEGAGHRNVNTLEPGRKGFGWYQTSLSRQRRGCRRNNNFIAIARRDDLRRRAAGWLPRRLFLRRLPPALRQFPLHRVQTAASWHRSDAVTVLHRRELERLEMLRSPNQAAIRRFFALFSDRPLVS